MKYQILYSWKNKKYLTNFSPAELAKRVEKVKKRNHIGLHDFVLILLLSCLKCMLCNDSFEQKYI